MSHERQQSASSYQRATLHFITQTKDIYYKNIRTRCNARIRRPFLEQHRQIGRGPSDGLRKRVDKKARVPRRGSLDAERTVHQGRGAHCDYAAKIRQERYPGGLSSVQK